MKRGQIYYLTDTACLVAREDVVFFAFLCFLAVLVAGAVGVRLRRVGSKYQGDGNRDCQKRDCDLFL